MDFTCWLYRRMVRERFIYLITIKHRTGVSEAQHDLTEYHADKMVRVQRKLDNLRKAASSSSDTLCFVNRWGLNLHFSKQESRWKRDDSFWTHETANDAKSADYYSQSTYQLWNKFHNKIRTSILVRFDFSLSRNDGHRVSWQDIGFEEFLSFRRWQMWKPLKMRKPNH